MRRREIITLLGAAAAFEPALTSAQQTAKLRRIGVLDAFRPSDSETKPLRDAFQAGLQSHGWTAGENYQFTIFNDDGNPQRIARAAAQLVGSAPDVILAVSPPAVAALKARTQTIPIVFVRVTNPVGGGLVASLARPGGNITGFSNGTDLPLVAKRLQFLKEVAPHLTRVALLYNPLNSGTRIFSGTASFSVLQGAAKSLGMEAVPIALQRKGDIERIAAFARAPRSGMVILPNAVADIFHKDVISLAARYRLPTISFNPAFVADGGLMAYGPDDVDLFRKAASYVDRILRGAQPGDLPVQEPTKFAFAINMKTARSLEITVPQSIVLQATDIIR